METDRSPGVESGAMVRHDGYHLSGRTTVEAQQEHSKLELIGCWQLYVPMEKMRQRIKGSDVARVCECNTQSPTPCLKNGEYSITERNPRWNRAQQVGRKIDCRKVDLVTVETWSFWAHWDLAERSW
jgi:hypothetical protein